MRILFIIFVIAFAWITLSCMEKETENFMDDIRTENRYVQNYKITLERKCANDEKDLGTYCEKEGCPDGFERGRGANKLMCYPKCLDGYESDGSNRCYKACPIGYDTRLTQCAKPRHEYAKDILPCRNCKLEPVITDVLVKENVRDPTIGVITAHPQMVRTALMDVDGSVVMSKPSIRTRMSVPLDIRRTVQQTTNSMRTDNANSRYSGVNPVLSNGILQEGFDGNGQNQIVPNGEEGAFLTPPPQVDPSVPPMIPDMPPVPPNSPTTEISSPETMVSNGDYMYGKKVARRSTGGSGVSVVDPDGQLPCPLGYSLSGDLCYENCGPQYRDEGDKCIREKYTIDRPSYDRGAGIPYVYRRSKFERISQE